MKIRIEAFGRVVQFDCSKLVQTEESGPERYIEDVPQPMITYADKDDLTVKISGSSMATRTKPTIRLGFRGVAS